MAFVLQAAEDFALMGCDPFDPGNQCEKCADIAAAFKKDGVRGDAIGEFARRRAERDMFRWLLVLE